jgi:uroporphyrinogen III methyltransferase/synthase
LENIVTRVQEARFKPPAIIIVGHTIQLRSELKWRERKPLWGAAVVVTRARAQASELVHQIEAAGGQALEFPSIEIVREDLSTLHQYLDQISEYKWLIFTSVNGVDIFFEEMLKKQVDIRQLRDIRICAIGPATAQKLTERGLIADLVPDEYLAEGILAQLRNRVQPGDKVLLPRARGARMVLPDTLIELGASVDEAILYQADTASRIDPEHFQRIRNGQVDYITFTSSSTVINFVKIMGADIAKRFSGKVKVACIGPITADTARAHGFQVDIVPTQYTIPALLESIIADYRG